MANDIFSLRYRETPDVQRALDVLGPKKAPRVMARAINRAATSTRTVMQRLVAKDTKLKVGAVRDQIRIEKAKPVADGLRARIIITGARIPLYLFGARPTKRGVSANTGQGRKVYPHTFIARMKSGHIGVFERKSRGKGSTRLPIIEKFGPSLPHVFAKHAPEGLARGEESLQKNLAHELEFALKPSST